MGAANVARLLALSLLWSASFVFLRVLAPALGPVGVAAARLLLGGTALVAWVSVSRVDVRLRSHWRAYLFVGVLNSALPFLLFGYAALHLPASTMAILNAASPLFSALAAAVWLAERLTPGKLIGLLAGAVGVALVSRADVPGMDASFSLAVGACLAAALCYALAAVWLKRRGAGLQPMAVAGWSQLLAGLALLPALAASPMPGPFTAIVFVDALALGLLSSGVAYALYYRLIAEAGPTRALTVTFLIPGFAMLWGALFLDETITLPMFVGAALIVGGTAAVLRPRRATS